MRYSNYYTANFKNKILRFAAGLASVVILISCTSDRDKESNSSIKIVDNQNFVTAKAFSDAFNILIVSDWGRNGIPLQQEIADQMGKTGDSIEPEFIVSCGDNFQINGVASVMDPLWLVNFENVYKSNSLHVDWYPVLGNHDYKGSTQAQIDYSKISRRWRMPSRYYTFTREINDSVSARFIFLDTPALIEKYRNDPDEYPDAVNQDIEAQMKWLNGVLKDSNEQWILVFGHHPVYSASEKHGNTKEMLEKVKPLLDRYNVQFYFCGHDHDMQHLRDNGGNVEYIVTGTGSETRPISKNGMSLFSSSVPGFSIVSFKADSLSVCFTGTRGNIVYRFERSYKVGS